MMNVSFGNATNGNDDHALTTTITEKIQNVKKNMKNCIVLNKTKESKYKTRLNSLNSMNFFFSKQ